MRSRLQDTAPFRLPQNLLATFLLSLWWTQPSGGFRLASAIFNASSASSAVMFGPIDHPTMRRDHMSITSARYSQPWRVFT